MYRALAFVIGGLAASILVLRATAEIRRPGPAPDPRTVPPATASMIDIAYGEPANAAHAALRDRLRKREVLEHLRVFLSPLRLPQRLLVTIESCNRPNAYYHSSQRRVSICYEYLDLVRKLAPTETTPEGVTHEDAVVAGVVHVLLHEVSHAVFHILQIPILGREEDAADQIANFLMLQFGRNIARRVIGGRAHLFDQAGLKRSAHNKRDHAAIHATHHQRFYNILCLAYGHDPKNFEDYVQKNILPPSRARRCRAEYLKVERAFRTLLVPHIDRELMEKVRKIDWLRPDDGRS
jgi:hypothetical protein